MRTKQTILFILPIIFAIGFFLPLSIMKAHIPMSSVFGQGVQEDFELSLSAFNMLTDNSKVKYDPIFISSLILMPVFTVIIAVTQKYKWLFTLSSTFLLYIFSTIYLWKLNTTDELLQDMPIRFGIGWAFFIIPSLIMLVMGLIALSKDE